MIKTDKEIVDSQKVAARQQSIDGLNRKLDQINEQLRQLDGGYQSISNLTSSRDDSLSRMGVGKSNQYWDKRKQLVDEKAQIESQIANYKKEIDAIGSVYQNQYTAESVAKRTDDSIVSSKNEEVYKKAAFAKVKAAYKKESLKRRLEAVLIDRRGINWNRIYENSSSEDLKRLLDIREGKEEGVKQSIQDFNKLNKQKGMSYIEMDKHNDRYEWVRFLKELEQKSKKNNQVEEQQQAQGRGR